MRIIDWSSDVCASDLTGRTILPLFHAFFSFGTVIGAGLGVFAAAAGVPLFTHAGLIAGAIALLAILSVANVPSRDTALDEDADDRPRPDWRARLPPALTAWREPRTSPPRAPMRSERRRVG